MRIELSDFFMGLVQMLRYHLRPNDEPKDLAYFMAVAMILSGWSFVLLLPVGALYLVLRDVITGSVDINTLIRIVLWVGTGLVLILFFLFTGRIAKWQREKAKTLLQKAEALTDQHLRDYHEED